MGVHTPTDLIVKILSRLPSKSLLRCRSVCKSWLSLISSTQFRLLYLQNFSRHLVLRVSWTKNKGMYIVPFNNQDTRVPIELPLNLHLHLRTIGCCNGVICLSDDYSGRDETILWNPSIRKKLTLIPPFYRENNSQSLSLVFGFGYDEMTDDYKVVRLAYNSRLMTIPHVEVYTVKTAIWRVVAFPHDLPCFCILPKWIHARLCFNGSAHWIACANSLATHSSILTFDMSTERFCEIQLPENLAQEFPMKLGLVIVEESLGVIYSSRVYYTSSTYVIWAMKEYKNPASWTMLYNIHYPDKDAGRALGVTNNGDLITKSTEGSLKIYNQEGSYNAYGNSSNEGIVSETIFVERYGESLGLLDVGDDIGNEGQLIIG